MKIEIPKINNQKKYYGEIYTINRYIKKIIKNPELKISDIVTLYTKITLILLFICIICLLLFILYKNKIIITYGITLTLVTFLMMYLTIYKLKIEIKNIIENNKAIKSNNLKINKNEIIKEINIEKNIKTYTISWKELKYIIINKYTIYFIPKNILITAPIATTNEIKEELIKSLKEINKENYIIDNTNLYLDNKSKNIFNRTKEDLKILF